MTVVNFLKRFLPETRPLTSAEKYVYMGMPTMCVQCGKALQARTIKIRDRNVIRIFCPNTGRDDSLLHEWYQWSHMGGEVDD